MMTRPWRHLFSLSLPFGPLILLSSPFLRWVGLFAAHRPRLAEGRVWRQRYGSYIIIWGDRSFIG